MEQALELLLVAGLVAGNAFFVVAEYALVTSRRSALEQRAQEGRRGARVALELMDDPVRFISTVQIGITALGILIGALGEPVVRELLGDAVPRGVSFLIAFGLVTYVTVAFGELVPKALALHAAEPIAMLLARPIDLVARSLKPAVWVLQASSRLVLRPLGIPAVTAGDRPISREELRGVLQDAEESGELHPEEEDMLTGIIDLRLREARDVMRPWEDVATVSLEDPVAEALDAMFATPHTRFPVLERPGGAIVGVLHARDAWTAWRDAGSAEALDLRELARTPVIVPPTSRVDELLRTLRRARQQLGVVVDEYGRPAGIVTIEDILEEIVGEIEDEFDVLDARFEQVGDREWLVDATVSVVDFNRRAGADLDMGRAHSVGGIVFEQLGRVPHVGDRTDLDGVTLTVEQLDGHRIALVRAELG